MPAFGGTNGITPRRFFAPLGPYGAISLWGYGTGIVSATDPVSGDVVLAELTLPFNHQDVVWVHPVYDRAVAAQGRRPTNLAADAADAAWHVSETGAAHDGMAAVPRNRRRPAPPRDADGHPICARGRAMVVASAFTHEDGFRTQRARCPWRWPARTGEPCDHARFAQGGCTKDVNVEAGGRMRAQLDRRGEEYRRLYRQRTSAERITSQGVRAVTPPPLIHSVAPRLGSDRTPASRRSGPRRPTRLAMPRRERSPGSPGETTPAGQDPGSAQRAGRSPCRARDRALPRRAAPLSQRSASRPRSPGALSRNASASGRPSDSRTHPSSARISSTTRSSRFRSWWTSTRHRR